MSKPYTEIYTEHRRLSLLRTLLDAPAYKANDSILHAALKGFGLVASRAVVLGDIGWLQAAGLVAADELPGATCTVVTLTQAGEDVARGNEAYPGVHRPAARG